MRSDDVIADRYLLVEVIGAGGTGTVWLAEDLRGHRKVALRRPLTIGPGCRADLEREVEIARKFRHANAVEVYGVVGDGDDCWLAMEYFRATSLATKGVLPPRAVAAIGAQVADALAAAHAEDVVHRDVAPGNVLVADDGTAKVTDFGVSAWRGATTTGSGRVCGTPAFVSPEVADGGRASAMSDMFSLGATLFAAVEGRPPFGTGDPDACLRRIRSGREEIAVRAGALKPVLDALLQRDRATRPTAVQAGEMLDRVAAGQQVSPWPGVRRQPHGLLAAAAVAVIALLLLTVVRPWESEAGGPARTVLGDPRTADPCAVADSRVLGRFGNATVAGDHGGFDRCDVLIAVSGDDEIDVVFRLDSAATGEDGPPRVVRHAPRREIDGCGIALTLADLAVLEITARSDDDVDTDYCQVATVAADQAEHVLARHREFPRRPSADPRSLARVDACRLVPRDELATVPAFAGASPSRGFGGWTCRWQSEGGALRVVFERADLAAASEGTRTVVAGRDVYVEPEGYGEFTCAARVFHLRYADRHGGGHVELALVVAEGGASMTDLCRVAVAFAAPVATRLPEV
ncbi:serine/threonine-protein kinase [Actinophytocola oryzae]|uniref:Serine/threonine protein kinase n=1 Tax=Actinophytocola oryzae TaxID=502181 RepID=A0A4R7VVT6_9PSEU|nr:serine/threonine-protein kinase [Actinophytocola oryzae]TDV53748.1 serine/threonine protein kinase [Actinophytocola oryzae]